MRAALGATLIVFTLAAIVALSACKDDKKGSTPGAGETPAAEETPAGEPSPEDGDFSLQESGVSAPLGAPYAADASGAAVEADTADLPFTAGSVSAHWYQQDGTYVVWFEDFPLEEPLCPGASIQLPSGGFEGAANASTGDGSGCLGVSTVMPPPTGAYLCDGEFLMFLTAVSTETDGELYASTNRQFEDGSYAGILAHAPTNLDETPEVDLNSCEGPTG